MSHNVLVIGGGGREHAIVWALSKSPQVAKIWCAPGNAGIASLAACVDVDWRDGKKFTQFLEDKKIEMLVIQTATLMTSDTAPIHLIHRRSLERGRIPTRYSVA